MRIVSWNMNHCMRSVAARGEAWEYLRDGLRADIALLQEASPPSALGAVYRPIDGQNPRYAWGSAVVSFRPDLVLRPRPRVALSDCYLTPVTGGQLPDSHPGACAVADVVDEEGRAYFTAVSLYGQWEQIADGRIYACARLHRMISDLTGVFATAHKCPVVVAGDLNVTTQIAFEGQTQGDTDTAAAVLERLRAWGLTECVEATRASRPTLDGCSCGRGETCGHVRTLRLRNRSDSRPTQLDYAFVSKGLVPRMRSCEVVQSDVAWALSDHCPLVIEIEPTPVVVSRRAPAASREVARQPGTDDEVR